MHLKSFKSLLIEKNIKFLSETGLSNFYYTAITFENIKTARKVQIILEKKEGKSWIISKCNNGRYGFIFYEI